MGDLCSGENGEGTMVKYSGFEIEAMTEDGFKVSQNMYELEMLQRWNITKATEVPNYRINEDDGVPSDRLNLNRSSRPKRLLVLYFGCQQGQGQMYPLELPQSAVLQPEIQFALLKLDWHS